VLRSASFHGTGGALALANDWSDNELDYCYEDNQVPPPSSPQLVCVCGLSLIIKTIDKLISISYNNRISHAL